MKRLLLALFALAYFAFGPVPAVADEPKCQPLAVAVDDTAAAAKKFGGEVKVFNGKKAAAYLLIVNETPPISTLKADMIMVLVIPERGAVLGLVEGESVCLAGRISLDIHKKALEAAEGKGT